MLHHIEVQALLLLLIATLVGIVSRRFRVPYTLALVVAGLVLGFVRLPALSTVELDADLLLLVLLPALLFEAAFHIPWDDFRRELAPILTLAVPGVFLAAGVTAGLAYLSLGSTGVIPGFDWSHALLFGVVIAATDPISVLALFRELGVTRRLYLLVEGESLLNDGVAVVLFVIVAAVFGIEHGGEPAPVLAGASEVVAYGLVTFGRMAVGGVLVGLLIGGAVSALTRQIDDRLIEVTLTSLVAYGSFLVAEEFHCSGVLSTVAAGLVMGSVGARYGMSPATKNAVEDFWEYMAFLANSFIFLLVGLRLEPGSLLHTLAAVVIAFTAVLLARALALYCAIPIVNRFLSVTIPMSWRHVMVWGGLRGSLSMVLVLTLPDDFVGKGFLVNLVFGVVALSLFLQGLTVPALLRRLGLLTEQDTHSDYELARAKRLNYGGALAAVDRLHEEGVLSRVPHDSLKRWYAARFSEAEREAHRSAGASEIDEQLTEGLRRLGIVERETIRRSLHAGLINEFTAAALETEVLQRLEGLDASEQQGEQVLRQYLATLLDDEAIAVMPESSDAAELPEGEATRGEATGGEATGGEATGDEPDGTEPDGGEGEAGERAE